MNTTSILLLLARFVLLLAVLGGLAYLVVEKAHITENPLTTLTKAMGAAK